MHDETNPIEAVRARLDGGRQWHKGDLFDKLNRDKVCIIGACRDELLTTGHLGRVLNGIQSVIEAQYPDRLGWDREMMQVAAFNDHPDTIWPDVDAVLDKASVAWDEAHQ
jgi:hypothetical protein